MSKVAPMTEALLDFRAVSKRFVKRLDAVERLARRLGAQVTEHTVHAVDDVLEVPAHPYTRGLLDSVPANNVGARRLNQIPGMTPSLLKLAPGCAFRDRCSRAAEPCGRMPELAATGARRVRCHFPLTLAAAAGVV